MIVAFILIWLTETEAIFQEDLIFGSVPSLSHTSDKYWRLTPSYLPPARLVR
jgi:hypothetical protein